MESITDSQWEIALQKILEAGQSPKVYLIVKVMEICNAHPLLRHKTANNQNNKETLQKTPREGKESNNKGKRKRKGEEMKEDDLLWQRLIRVDRM